MTTSSEIKSSGGSSLSTEAQEGRERTPPSVSFPVHRYAAIPSKPHAWLIEGMEVGPETVLGSGRDQTPREFRITKKYLMLKAHGKPVCVARGELLLLDPADGLPIADLHHFKRFPNGRRLHQMKEMAFACHDHNADLGPASVIGVPPVSGVGEREKGAGSAPLPQASSLESAVHAPARAMWDEWVASGKPWSRLRAANCLTLTSLEGAYYLADDLTDLAENDLIDPTYGKLTAQTFMKFARADRFGVLEMLKDKGRWWVRLRRAKA